MVKKKRPSPTRSKIFWLPKKNLYPLIWSNHKSVFSFSLTLLALILYHQVAPFPLVWQFRGQKLKQCSKMLIKNMKLLNMNIPELNNSMALTAGWVVCWNVCHPSFPPKKVTTLTMYIKGFCWRYVLLRAHKYYKEL